MTNIIPLPSPKPRISAKLRQAVHLMARNGLTQTAAAEVAGLSRQGLCKALKRLEVLALVEQIRASLTTEAARLREFGRVAALEVAIDLLINSKDEKIKARMVEFLAGDGKTVPVAVHIDARLEMAPATGYRYRKPTGLL
ncbi:helix-turn-helix domain-containing protein [Tabrizicola sp.]|uniref:MarR family transcriptional regulator n=1 Tax=Tabrizicola sp. TaxID=2005166 RepID=UPI00286C8316|nr:helix-turn-helix domain-containing protein [Tabrizicola sp.]